MRMLVFLLSFGALTECCFAQTGSTGPEAASCELSPDDYAVYAAVLKDLVGPVDSKGGRKTLLVVDTTAPLTTPPMLGYVKGSSGWGSGWGLRSASKAAPADDTRTDFEAKVTDVCWLSPEFGNPPAYRLIPQWEIGRFFARLFHEDGWSMFHKKYPNAGGFLSFSRPGNNASRNQAEVMASVYCGNLCGTGYLFLLTRKSGRWQIRNRLILWVS